MIMTNPIVGALARLCDAPSAYHELVSMPYSKMKAAIVSTLQTGGYIKDYQVEEMRVGKTLILNLKYSTKRERAVSGARRVSKPGLRVYARSNKLPEVIGGFGVAIISSSSELLTDRGAADKGVGGKVIAYI